jgi:hypothetical protein
MAEVTPDGGRREVEDAGWQLGTHVSAISIQKANRQPGI